MKLAALLITALIPAGAAQAQSQPEQLASQQAAPAAQQPARASASGALQQKLAPGLAKYTNEVLFGEVWPGPGLSPRDRSLAVISVLIATNKPGQLRGHLTRALNNGVTPVEASGVLIHLALYAGWPSAVTALEVFDEVYTERNVDFAALQVALPPLAPAATDAAGADAVTAQFGIVAPKFADLTNRVVFGDLWLRSDLSVRDRSLVTIAALAGMGDADLLEPYLRRGVEAGLTRDQIAEALTQLGFYAGWGKATKALEVVTRILGAEAPG
ncbi:carboxymuconolactone decarboxylase family protein [Rhizobium aouanii]|uniref:Carboxymuconolactone decarboxylase family protein n=1 Tax=Rhizobium aouanii TaxID=3118145 RepID=A0ABU8CQR8_9HYPH